jgi:hypothetical protein
MKVSKKVYPYGANMVIKKNNSYRELKVVLRIGNDEEVKEWLEKWSKDKSKVDLYLSYYLYLVGIGCKQVKYFTPGRPIKTTSGENWTCNEPIGMKNDVFAPDLSPDVMLRLGVFGGSYINGWENDIPLEWIMMSLVKGKLQLDGTSDPKKEHNMFGVCSYQDLETWGKKGWLRDQDPLGWFQWYIRYYLGRRTDDDERQKNRWVCFKRHLYQIISNPDEDRPRQKQCCVQWGYNPVKVI